MSSCGAYFVCRRYGWKLAWIVFPILLLTMYARVALNEHTISAVLAGGFLGLLVSAIFTTRHRKAAVRRTTRGANVELIPERLHSHVEAVGPMS